MGKKPVTTAAEVVTETIKPPISFKEFAKEPVKGLMFLCILSVGYLYVDIKISNNKIQESQNKKIELLEKKVYELSEQLRKSDSTLSAAASKIKTLQELGKIK